jgi:hypothetical protein
MTYTAKFPNGQELHYAARSVAELRAQIAEDLAACGLPADAVRIAGPSAALLQVVAA